MNQPEAPLLRAYFESEQFKASPDLARRVVRALPAEGDEAAAVRWWPAALLGRRRGAAMVVAAVALVLSVTVAATFPAVRDVPSWFANWAGTSTSRVGPGQGSATSSGYTVRVAGTYADAARTAIFVSVEPETAEALGTATLVDPAGRPLPFLAGEGGGGSSALLFGPVAQAQSGPATLTLRLSSLVSSAPTNHDGTTVVRGDWVLSVTITSRGGRSLPALPPGRAGDVSVTFDSVLVAPGAIAMDLTVTGPIGVDSVRLLDGRGREMRATRLGQAIGGKGDPGIGPRKWTGIWFPSSPGPYLIRFTATDGSVLERTIPAS